MEENEYQKLKRMHHNRWSLADAQCSSIKLFIIIIYVTICTICDNTNIIVIVDVINSILVPNESFVLRR